MKKIHEEFRQFLKDNDCYTDFCLNLWNHRKKTFKEYLESEDEPIEERHFVGGAFIFANDESDYWELVDKKWRTKLLE